MIVTLPAPSLTLNDGALNLIEQCSASPGDGEGDGLGDALGEGLGDGDAVGLGLGLGDALGDGEGDGEALGNGDGLGDALGLGEGLGDAPGDGLDAGAGPSESVLNPPLLSLSVEASVAGSEKSATRSARTVRAARKPKKRIGFVSNILMAYLLFIANV